MTNHYNTSLRLPILASAAGTLLEWYDLFVAVILARVLSNQLFPAGESARFLETLAIIGASFFVRPLGSLFFGSLGDRKGRKKSFLLSLLLMGGATFLIGLLPTYQQAGWWSPVMLLALRLTQGFALSGEYAGAVIYVAENAPEARRGHYTGFIQATVPVGVLLCLMVVLGVQWSMSVADFNAWGWRIPFLASAILVAFSYFIRRKMEETPVFQEMQAHGGLSKAPVQESLGSRANWRKILQLVFGGNAAQSTIMHSAQFVTLFFLQRVAFLQETDSLVILAAALLAGAPFFQLTGRWSDRFGRKPIIFAGICLGAVSLPLSFYLFNTLGNPEHLTEVHAISPSILLLFMFLAFVNTFASALVYGPMGIYVMEYFPGRTRYTSMGFTYNLGNGLLGGATPLITEFIKSYWIVGAAMAPYVGLAYPMALIGVAIVVMALSKEQLRPTI